MFYRCLLQLAKAKGPSPRRHVLRRPLRRAVSSGGGAVVVARRGTTGRTAAVSSAHLKASRTSSPQSMGIKKGGRSGSSPRNVRCIDSDVSQGAVKHDSSGVTAVTVATCDGLGSAPAESTAASSASVRRPLYRLATAVATVVVPPSTNVFLQGMKHLLTPATSPPAAALRSAGLIPPTVSIAEEYYTSKKGPLFATAVVAGTNAVKQVSSLVPFCYPTPIHRCSFTFRRRQVLQPPRPAQMPHRVVLRRRTSEPSAELARPEYSVLYCFCTVATESKGGVEMEALTGATMASVTLYDMLKGLPGAQEDGLSLGESFVLAKRGGRNDFTKLLISEPDRPLVEGAVHSGGAEMHALPSSHLLPRRGVGDLSMDHEETSQSASTDSGVTAKENFNDNVDVPAHGHATQVTGEDRSDEETTGEVQNLAAKRVVRRAAPVAASAVASDASGELTTSADGDAWWHTSKHEKRIQELYPRRKYGDNARLIPTTAPPTTVVSSLTKADRRASLTETSEAEDEAATAPAAISATQTKSGTRASTTRDVRVSTAVKATTTGAALPRATGRPGARSSSAEVGSVGGEDSTVEHRRSINRSRLAKKSARAVMPAAEAYDDDEGEAAVAEDAEADEEAVPMTSPAADGTEEEEEAPAVTASNKKRRRVSTTSASTPKRNSPTVGVESSFYGKRPQPGSKRYPAEMEDEEEAHDAPEEEAAEAEKDDSAEDMGEEGNEEEEESEEQERAPVKSMSAVTARRMQAQNNLAERRTVRSVTAPVLSNTGDNTRKQRARRVVRKKVQSSAQADDDDNNNSEEYDDDVQGDNGAFGDDEDEAIALVAAKMRTKPAAKQIRSAASKKGGAMRPVRHDSWDSGRSQRSRSAHDTHTTGARDEGTEDGAAVAFHEDEEEGADDVAPPLPPPRKQVKKTVKRAPLKRR